MAEDSVVEKYEDFYVGIGDLVKEYEVIEKIDEGAFGQVFKVKHTKTNRRFAMKVEARRLDGGPPSLKAEMEVMMHLKTMDAKYFPRLVGGGKEPKFHWIAMDLLGESLKELRKRCPDPGKMPIGSWSRIGIQCLFVLKQIHDSGFLHRDLKPANFSLGPSDDVLHSRILYLLDFGITRKFVVRKKSASKMSNFKNVVDHEFRLARRHVRSFKGTLTYASPNAHAHVELGRGDDVWSLLFTIAELVKPLPWEMLDEPELKKKKVSCRLKDLLGGYSVFDPVETMLANCNYYQFPDYHMVYKALKSVLDESHASWVQPYDWETEHMPSYRRWRALAEQRPKGFFWENPIELGNYLENDPFRTLQRDIFSPSRENLGSVDEAERKRPKGKKKKRNGDTVTCETVTTCEEAPTPIQARRKSLVKVQPATGRIAKTPEKTAKSPTARTPAKRN